MTEIKSTIKEEFRKINSELEKYKWKLITGMGVIIMFLVGILVKV